MAIMVREIHRAAKHIQDTAIVLKSFFQAVQLIQFLWVSASEISYTLNPDILKMALHVRTYARYVL